MNKRRRTIYVGRRYRCASSFVFCSAGSIIHSLIAMQVSLRHPGSERLAAPGNTSALDPHHLTPYTRNVYWYHVSSLGVARSSLFPLLA